MNAYNAARKKHFTTDENKEFLLLVDILNKRFHSIDNHFSNVVYFYDVMGNEKLNSLIKESNNRSEFLTGSLPKALIDLRRHRKTMIDAKNDYFSAGNEFAYERDRRFDPHIVTSEFDYKEARKNRDRNYHRYRSSYVG